mmetsp:Transcript_107684/g.309996  ORF Transcript_107684/g.309996 Transcript_107684/m.309996 type:complete len:227 (+) Transcript_107684:539-1219(+)
MTGLVPMKAPNPVPAALAKYANFDPGNAPSRSKSPACWPMPCCTPAVSKTTMKSMQKTEAMKACGCSTTAPKSRCNKAGTCAPTAAEASAAAALAASDCRASCRPRACEANAVKMMPMIVAPFVPRTKSAAINTVDVKAKHNDGCVMSPNPTIVASLFTISPMSWNPTKAWNTPMATVMDDFNDEGRTPCAKFTMPLMAKTANNIACAKQHARAASGDMPNFPTKP